MIEADDANQNQINNKSKESYRIISIPQQLDKKVEPMKEPRLPEGSDFDPTILKNIQSWIFSLIRELFNKYKSVDAVICAQGILN